MFVREALAVGPRLSGDLLTEAKARGISRATLYRAVKRLGVVTERVGEHSSWKMDDGGHTPPIGASVAPPPTTVAEIIDPAALPKRVECMEHRQFFHNGAHFAFYEEEIETNPIRIRLLIDKGIKYKVLR